MAFILVKGPIANINGIFGQIQEKGFIAQYLGMRIEFPPHEAKILSPYSFDWRKKRFQLESAKSPCVVCVYDPYNCIPLADGKLITNSKLFFDDANFLKYFASADLFDKLRFSTCSAVPNRITLSRFIIAQLPPNLICAGCNEPINGAYYTEPEGLAESSRPVDKLCRDCVNERHGYMVVHGPAEVLIPDSPIAKFLLENITRSFAINILLLPHTSQTVFLIGDLYYISSAPIPAAVHNRLYKNRQRLRMTSKIVQHLFANNRERAKKKRTISVQVLFDEFVSDLR